MKYKNEVVNLNPGKKKFVKFLIFDFFVFQLPATSPFMDTVNLNEFSKFFD